MKFNVEAQAITLYQKPLRYILKLTVAAILLMLPSSCCFHLGHPHAALIIPLGSPRSCHVQSSVQPSSSSTHSFWEFHLLPGSDCHLYWWFSSSSLNTVCTDTFSHQSHLSFDTVIHNYRDILQSQEGYSELEEVPLLSRGTHLFHLWWMAPSPT